jgi:hypothetical protein
LIAFERGMFRRLVAIIYLDDHDSLCKPSKVDDRPQDGTWTSQGQPAPPTRAASA